MLTPTYTTLLDVVATHRRGERPGIAGSLLAPLRNPLLLATAAGLGCNLAGLRPPEGLLAPIELLADLAVPAMLLAFGLSLAHAQRPGRDDDVVCLGAVIVLKNLVHPVLAWTIGTAFGLSGPALLAVVVSAALPTAQNVFGYAVRFDDRRGPGPRRRTAHDVPERAGPAGRGALMPRE